MNEKRLHTIWQQKVFTKLLGLQYKIIYKKGVDNSVTDALSRCSPSAGSEQVLAISTVTPQWLTEVVAGYNQDPLARDLLSKLSLNPTAVPGFTLTQGILKHHGKIWLGSNATLHFKVFSALHNSALGGHSGAPATYHRIHYLFSWPHMKTDITQWVQQCSICQQAKPDRSNPYLFQMLPG